MHTHRFVPFLLVIFQLALITHCAHIIPPPEDQPLARQLIAQLKTTNQGLSRFKALAQLRMASDAQAVVGRIAIAAVAPDKMRVEWLNMMGQPLLSISGDGENITIFRLADRKVNRLHQSATALQSLIQIPIGIEDLQRVLTGSVPIPDDTAAQIETSNDRITTLVFKNRWHATVAVAEVEQDTGRVRSMQRYDGQGILQYAIQWLRWREQGQYILPVLVELQSGSGERLKLTIDRIWPNAEVPASLFELETP